jgi:hypothetical protein
LVPRGGGKKVRVVRSGSWYAQWSSGRSLGFHLVALVAAGE